MNSTLVQCCKKTSNEFCENHAHRYRFEKPECPICFDEISSETETPLECGHWIHKQCLNPTNLHICPVCRQSMKQHEVDFIFGKNHQQHNQYSQNYYIPFDSESLFSQQFIQTNRVNFNIEDYNNQEHFFNEVESEYLEDENHNGLEFNDFEQDNLGLQNSFLENNYFSNMSEQAIEWIVEEIETRPRNNPYVTLPNDMSEIPNNLRTNFIQFVDRVIHDFGVFNNFNIDEIMLDEIREQLFAIEADRNLLRIHFNMTFVPHMNINILMRIQTLVNNTIRIVHDNLTFNF